MDERPPGLWSSGRRATYGVQVRRLLVMGSNPAADKSLIFNWRRFEGCTHYLASLNRAPLALGIFSVIKKQEKES